MVFGLRHEQQRSDLDDAMHSSPRGERDRLSAMQAGEAVCINTQLRSRALLIISIGSIIKT